MGKTKSRKGIGGKPRKYKTPDELEKLCDAYFDSCWEDVKVVDEETGEVTTKKSRIRPYTISGLCLHIGSYSKQLRDYENNFDGEYSHIIKEAKSKVENYIEELTFRDSSVTGPIFNLKCNFGYVEEQHIKVTSENKNLNVNVDADSDNAQEAIRSYTELLKGNDEVGK